MHNAQCTIRLRSAHIVKLIFSFWPNKLGPIFKVLSIPPYHCLIFPLYHIYILKGIRGTGCSVYRGILDTGWSYCSMCAVCSVGCLKRGGTVAESTNQPSSFVFPKSYHYLNFALTLIFAFSFWQTVWNLRLKPVLYFVCKLRRARQSENNQ